MRVKLSIALSLVLLFGIIFSAQVTREVEASSLPLTSPITAPLSSFRISGHVTLHILRRFRVLSRFLPAEDVKIRVINKFSGEKFTTKTDTKGDYFVDTNKRGFYEVEVASRQHNAFFVPPVKFVKVKDPSGKSGIDFRGLIF